jgi:tricorn protease-like protein
LKDGKEGKEVEEGQDNCKEQVRAVAVSRDNQWVVIACGDNNRAELKVCEVETGTMKNFKAT